MSSQLLRLTLVGALSLGFLACKGGSASEDGPQTDFVSDDPTGAGTGPSTDAGTAADTGGATPTDGGTSDEQDPARAIEEADIVKISGTRLYALSKIGGLSVIDVSTRDSLKMLGHFRPNGQPFEMYVRDDVVLAMVNGYQEWSSTGVRQTSRVVALDVRDPAKIARLGDFTIPGEVSDSRVVGDVMYVVSYQNGYCWGCGTAPSTVVMSLGIKEPRAITKVDEVAFTSPTASYGWSRRSVSATNQRFWIGGPEYAWTGSGPAKSTIQALDVSDATGKLKLGATVTLDGLVQSRWQMDEVSGVLRVISQPGWSGDSPSVQTFTVKSSSEVTPLGSTKITLPKPESLMSVRFDGTRAYAITAQRTDPLFTIDLTDPSKPVQKGQLEMPGWVMYMEPRGNRMLGLGFDQTNPDGAMTVSLFDVADLAKPTMIKRVNFGKGWASAPEDADRIHKAFRVLDDQKLILVPYSSYDWRSSDGTCHHAESGIQLIDWKDDTLALRGMAPVWGSPRRAFLHDQRLFAVSDGQVATFDIADRDKPIPKADLNLGSPAHRSVVVGDYVASLSHDWWNSIPRLAITPRADVTQLPVATLDLSGLVSDPYCYAYGWTSWWTARLFASPGWVHMLVSTYYDKGGSTALLVTFDVRDPLHPKVAGKLAVDAGMFDSYSWYYGDTWYYSPYDSLLSVGERIAYTGKALASLRTQRSYDSDKRAWVVTSQSIGVIDLRDPSKPRVAGSLSLPNEPFTAPQVSGDRIFLSHYTSIGDGKVRFYLDEIDVANPDAPTLVRSVNTPGSLLLWDQASSRAITVDYKRTYFGEATDWSTCESKATSPDALYFDWTEKTCTVVHRSLRLTKIDGEFAKLEQSFEFPAAPIGNLAVADGRVILRSSNYGYYGDGSLTTSSPVDRVWVLSGMRDGMVKTSAPIDLDLGWNNGIWAVGDRALAFTGLHRLAVIDTSSARLLRSVEIDGYYPYDVTMTPDTAYISLGDPGLAAVPLR